MIKDSLTRRAFIAATTTTAALAVMPGRAAAGQDAGEAKVRLNTARVVPGKVSPNERLNVAAIGAGGKGAGDIRACASAGENIVALCDPDWDRAAQTFEYFGDARKYKDFRKMLEEMPEIDACTISTPDHTHAPAAYLAMNLGKHVYVQKPLTHTVAEARLLTRLAEETGVATQMGNQGRCGDGVRLLCEMVWSGAIGEVKEAHIWTNRPIWPQGLDRPAGEDPVPDHLDWDLWLGPAAHRPYIAKHPESDRDCYAPWMWRGWWDFGCGALGDMACHIMDPAYWALQLGAAASYTVEALEQDGMTDEQAPNASVIKYEFPARAGMGAVDVYWYDGGRLPERPADIPARQRLGDGNNGSLFIGSDGYITAGEYGGNARLMPNERMEDYTPPAPYIPRIPGESPYRNWLYACKGGPEAASHFAISGPFTEMVNFGNVALRLGRKLAWDNEAGEIIGDDADARRLITKEYRKGWELPC